MTLDLATGFTRALLDFTEGIDSLKASLEDFVRSALDLLAELLIVQPVAQGISSFAQDLINSFSGGAGGGGGGPDFSGVTFPDGSTGAAAHGATVFGGETKFMARGGFPIDNMAIFPTRGGDIIAAGEEGKEFALEVARLPSGNLGVRAEQGGGSVVNVGAIHVGGGRVRSWNPSFCAADSKTNAPRTPGG